MKIIDLSTEREKIRSVYRIIGFLSLAVITITSTYGVVAALVQDANVVGENLVTLEVPPISVFPLFYSKPITWLTAALFALFFSALELGRDDVLKWSKFRRDMLKFAAFFIGGMAAYEVMFNFTLWGGLIASDSILGELNVDIIKNTFPNPNTPWNIVFATKLFTALFIISVYAFYYLQQIESTINKKL